MGNCASENSGSKYKPERQCLQRHIEERTLLPQKLMRADVVNTADHNGNPALHVACDNNDVRMVQLLLRVGAKQDILNDAGKTALIIAAEKGHLEVVLMLLQHRDNAINIKTPRGGFSALHFASSEGHEQIVNALIDKGYADIFDADKKGNTVTQHAASNGHFGVVKSLLMRGAKMQYKDNQACQGRNLAQVMLQARAEDEVLEYILNHTDTDPLHRDEQGRTIIHYAVTTSYPEAIPPILDRALRAGIAMLVDITDDEGKTPLHVAAERGDSEMTEYLLQSGATSTLQDLLGNTCLHHASSSSDDMSVVKILRRDSRPTFLNIQNGEMQTALHLAVMQRNTVTLYTLLRHESDLNIRDSKGRSPLHLAVLMGNVEAVDCLSTQLDRMISNVDNYGDSPLGLACLERNTAIVKFLLEHGENAAHLNGAEESTLILLLKNRASESQRESTSEIYEALIAAGAPTDVRSLNRNSALSLAIENAHTDIATKLVSSVNCSMHFNDGNTALHLAIQKQMSSLIDEMLPYSNVNMQNCSGETPLHTLINNHAHYGDLHSLPLLGKLSNSLSLTATDKEQRTPLLLAMEYLLIDVVKWLLLHGSSVSASNIEGNTILHLVAKEGNLGLLSYLLDNNTIRCKLYFGKQNRALLTAREVAMKAGNMEVCRRLAIRHKNTLRWSNASASGPDDLLIRACARCDFHQFNNALLRGADPNVLIDGVPLIFVLIDEFRFEELDVLLSFDVSMSVRHNSLTVLHALMLCRQFEIDAQFEAVLEKDGELLDIPSRENVTPLWLAVGRRDHERVSELLKRGADPNTQSSATFDCPNGRFGPCSILDLARFRRDKAILQSLMIFGAKKSHMRATIMVNGEKEWLPSLRELDCDASANLK